MYECKYCNNSFKTKSSLNQHQKHTKYCLSIQNIDIPDTFKCDACNKKFSMRHHLSDHQNICKEQMKYLKYKLNEMTKERDLYKGLYEQKNKIVEEMAQRPTSTTNNTRNNNLVMLSPLDLSPERIKSVVENSFAIEHFNDGQKGVANFAVEFILRDEEGNVIYQCGDCTRQTFRYKDMCDQIIKDVKARKLTKLLAPEIKVKTTQLAKDMYTDDVDEQERVYTKYNSIQKIDKDNTEFVNQLSSLTV